MLVNILNTARCASVDIKSVLVQMRFSAFIIFHHLSFCVWCVICVQQHALRLMAFGQIYKVLEMEPLPSNKPSQKYPWSDKEGVYLFLFPIAALPARPVLDQTRPWLSSHTCHDLSGWIMCFLCTSVALPASSERLTY